MSDIKAFNTTPHFDDFDEKNNFQRVLFRPSIPVQVRELNQMQTILQNQIANSSSFSFRNGARVANGETSLVDKIAYITVTNLTNEIQNYLGAKVQRIVSSSVVLEATVIAVIKKTTTDANVLYLSYKSSDSNSGLSEFQPAQSLNVIFADTTQANETITVAVNGKALGFSVNEGIYYFNGQFVHVPKQFAIVNKFSNVPQNIEVSVGFNIYESVVTPEEDPSLYDNAIGSPNESAPGAYRYRIQAILTTKADLEAGISDNVISGDSFAVPDASTDVSNYYEIAVIKNGSIQLKPRQDGDISVLEQTLARRTFDESGDYLVDNFAIQLNEHLNGQVIKSGTYSQTTNTITVTVAAHGLSIGDTAFHDFTSGTSTDNSYIVTAVDGIDPLNKYTVTARDSKTTSGNVTIRYGENAGLYTVAQGGSEAKLAVTLDKGKAYVRGFEVETRGNTYLDLDKARTTQVLQNQLVQLQFNQAFYVYSASATQNLANPILFQNVQLRNAANAVIGTAFVRGFKYDSVKTISAVSKNVYRLDVIDVVFTGTNAFPNVDNILGTGTYPFAGKVVPAAQTSFIANQKESTLIWSAANGFTKSTIHQLFSRYYEKNLTTTSSAGQPTLITFSTETAGETFDADPSSFAVFVDAATDVSGIPQSVVLSNANKTATLDITNLVGTAQNGLPTIVTSQVYKTDAVKRSKTLTVAPALVIASAAVIPLPNTDVFKLLSVKNAAGQEIKDFYTLDNGQRDQFYAPGSLKLKNGFAAPAGDVTITFSYFAHGTGDYFSVDSYTNISYDKIPKYVDGQNKTYFLGAAIDFRLDRPTTTSMPIVGANSFYANDPLIQTEEFYLSRMDKLVLTKRGEFQIINGTSAVQPELPLEPVDAISLYNINLPAYTFSVRDVTVSKLEYQRFTMKDISNIAARLKDVENATSLSLLENSINSRQDFNKYRNGFFVDTFKNQVAANINDPYHYVGYDMSAGELRPANRTYSIGMQVGTNTGLRAHSDGVYTLQYAEVPFVSQALASTTIRIQPYALSDFIGDMSLNPATDIWFDDKTVNTFQDAQGVFTQRYTFDKPTSGYDRRLNYTTWDVTNGIWTNVGTGKVATELEKQLILAGIRNAPDYVTGSTSTVNTSLASTTKSNTAIPYIRTRLVSFTASGLKPQTSVFLKFDGKDITSYAGMTEATIGAGLITSGGGSISGVFRIPNNDALKFLTGKRHVVVTDIGGDNEQYDGTVADCFYEAAGTLVTTTNKFVNTKSGQTSVRVYDPLAQSFFVKEDQFDDGIFISSIDVYFGPGISPSTNTESVRLEVRNIINGYPGPDIPHNGKVTVPASAIFGSKDASVATRFTFPSPVFLEGDNEYCFVLISKSETINVWASKLGQKAVVPGETVPNSGQEISKQSFLGSLFLSQNNTTWTAEQLMDMKFQINRCQFGSTGSLSLSNAIPASEALTDSDEYSVTLETNPFAFTSGSTSMRVYDFGHGFKVNDRVKLYNSGVTAGNVAQITYNGVLAQNIYTVGAFNPTGLLITAVDTPITASATYSQTGTAITITIANTDFMVGDTVTLDFTSGAAVDGDYVITAVTASNITVVSPTSQTTSGNVTVLIDPGFGSYVVTIATAATSTGRNGGEGNKANRYIDFSTLRLLSDAVVLSGTSANYEYRTRSFQTNALGSFESILPNVETTLPSQKLILTSGDSSAAVNVTMRTTKNNLSPIFDKDRITLVVQKNIINNFVDKFNGKQFGATARYVQRPITVVNPSNNINVFLDLNLPSGSSVKVYYRTAQSQLTGIWYEMPLATGDNLVNTDDPSLFRETKFSTGDTPLAEFYVSQVKIILISDDRAKVPRIKNFRSIVNNKF